MKIRADEHIAEAIVRAVNDVSLKEGWHFDSVVSARQAGKTDVHWITEFMAEGGDAILSADCDFLVTPPQVDAVFKTGAKVIHLPAKWAQSRGALQSAHILMWWSRIEDTLEAMKPRQCYRPTWNINEAGELKHVQIDFQSAQKKLKKKSKKAAKAAKKG